MENLLNSNFGRIVDIFKVRQIFNEILWKCYIFVRSNNLNGDTYNYLAKLPYILSNQRGKFFKGYTLLFII